VVDKITFKYTNGVTGVLKGPAILYYIVMSFVLVHTFYSKLKPSGFVPNEDGGRLYYLSVARGFINYPICKSDEKLMKIVASTPGILHYTAISGFNILNGGANSNNGSMFCMLTPWDERTTTPAARINGCTKKGLPKRVLKCQCGSVIQPPPIRGIGLAAGLVCKLSRVTQRDDIHAF
jgi:HAE1 family hydrophobic/amphiphilic exporter-1